MANRPDKHEKGVENSRVDDRPRPVPAIQVRQGFLGRPVLIILLSGLILAMLVWVPVEWWGNAIAPERESNDIRSEEPASSTAPGGNAGQPDTGG